ncbi:Bodo-specific multi-copy gene family, putative [Bodo saltans]|uniref:Bodo-specific multi-copy gene family, putative n=1 Tax=Bodo saltans TaxID=75058 RepID=A0A0S4JT35_BODSA|nr:Bodo-specific multi-copy gene family, putative [Bodo saltans]|eukprot:CUG92564.1 Bodo-specific multi-copy gene family, putative [Bodo saltans]
MKYSSFRACVWRMKVLKCLAMAALSSRWPHEGLATIQRLWVATAAGRITRTLLHRRRGTFPENVSYRDPRTWPKVCVAADIEALLRGNLAHSARVPDYKAVARLHNSGDTESLTVLLHSYTKPLPPVEVDMEEYLRTNLNNVSDSANMPLQERTQQLNALARALSSQPGSETRQIAFSSSPRGSGKTQFIKWFVFKKRADGMKFGRVLVLCCSKAEGTSLLARIIHGTVMTAADSTDHALCELIRNHVESVTGKPQDERNYSNPHSAYATWIRETSRHFRIPDHMENMEPLIILDTCELLAQHDHHSFVHNVTTGQKPFTMLEALCLSVPSPYSLFVTGCNARIDTCNSLVSAVATVTDIGPLLPLSEVGSSKALEESWGVKVSPNTAHALHHLTQGHPRMLRAAQSCDATKGKTCLASPSLPHYLLELREAARAQYPFGAKMFPCVYSCFLASMTKARVRGNNIIPINPLWSRTATDLPSFTYDAAALLSIGTYDLDNKRFIVPPIVTAAMSARADAPIMLSQLCPFLDAEVVERFDQHEDIDTATHLDKSFLYALYGRYLLEFWNNTSSPWVPLDNVFEGAVHPDQLRVLKRYELNLCQGVRTSSVLQRAVLERSLTYLGHHGSYMWCRDRVTGDAPFAVPVWLWETPATLTLNDRQSYSSAPLALFVNRCDMMYHDITTSDSKNILVDANEMSCLSWFALSRRMNKTQDLRRQPCRCTTVHTYTHKK